MKYALFIMQNGLAQVACDDAGIELRLTSGEARKYCANHGYRFVGYSYWHKAFIAEVSK